MKILTRLRMELEKQYAPSPVYFVFPENGYYALTWSDDAGVYKKRLFATQEAALKAVDDDTLVYYFDRASAKNEPVVIIDDIGSGEDEDQTTLE